GPRLRRRDADRRPAGGRQVHPGHRGRRVRAGARGGGAAGAHPPWSGSAGRERLAMIQSSLTYRDARLAGLDAAVLMEVIEHVEPARLSALERAVFGFGAPRPVVVTTTNREYNPEYGMTAGELRHRDHRFEWDRAQFSSWASRVADAYGYRVRFSGAGRESPPAGAPTQLAVFTRDGGAGGAA